jgi:peptidoglycan/xylan/chitin deacetylase (PgdA/CDA1 family)
MHNGAKYTSKALEAVIKGLQSQGYRIVPISQLIYTGEYTVNHEGRQFGK